MASPLGLPASTLTFPPCVCFSQAHLHDAHKPSNTRKPPLFPPIISRLTHTNHRRFPVNAALRGSNNAGVLLLSPSSSPSFQDHNFYNTAAMTTPKTTDKNTNTVVEQYSTYDYENNAHLNATIPNTHTNTAETAIISTPASLTRVIYSSVQPARLARTASPTGAGGSRSGPLSSLSPLMIIAIAVGTTTIAAIRSRLRAVRDCSSCKGYGVQRCKLCVGKGTIEWEGKMAHREPCPMCLGRRFNRCTCCGGGPFYVRNVFRHKAVRNETDLVNRLQSLAASSKTASGAALNSSSRLSRWSNPFRRNRNIQNDKIEESDQFAEEVMMD